MESGLSFIEYISQIPISVNRTPAVCLSLLKLAVSLMRLLSVNRRSLRYKVNLLTNSTEALNLGNEIADAIRSS